MGWFSSKKKTYVGTEVSRVVKNNQIPDLRQKNLIDSIFNNTRMSHTIVNNAMQSFALKAERAYRMAARGDYTYGTLGASILTKTDGKDTVKNIIEAELGESIQMDYFYFEPMNNLHVGWQKLTKEYDYDEFTNEVRALSAQRGHKVWVKDMVAYVNTTAITPDATAVDGETELVADSGTMEVWDRHPQDRFIPNRLPSDKTPVWQLSSAISDGVMIHLVEEDGYESTMFFNLEEFDDDRECFQAKYRYTVGGTARTGYFTYEYGSGAYPILDAIHENTPSTKGAFMPVVAFRQNSVNRTGSAYQGTAAYNSSEKLLKLLDMSYQDLGDAINANPDADDLEQVVMMFAVPSSSSNQAEIEYLYKFFNWLYLQSPDKRSNAIRFRDADFDSVLSYTGLKRKRTAGTIGDVDTHTHQRVQETRYRTVLRRVLVSSGYGEPDEYAYISESEPYTVETLKYQHQVYAGLYDEITVDNLQMRYNIYGDKGITANVGSEKLLIPIDTTIAKTLRFDRKEELYLRSLHFVMNSRVTVKVKWYQTGVFQIVMLIVAVAITIVTAGAGSPIGVAMTAGAYATVAVLVIQQLVMQYIFALVITKGIQIVADELGFDATIILAVSAFIAAGYGVYNEAAWVDYAIAAANGLVSASANVVTDQLAEYQTESQEFALMADTKLKELEELDNLLNSYDLLDPRSFTGMVPSIFPGETPDALYNRTVHSGNIGTVAFDYIESYVDINLQLPTFNDLVGDTFYAAK